MRWTRRLRTQHFTHSSNAPHLTGSRVRQLTVVCVTFRKNGLIFSYSWTYGSSRRWRRTHCSLCVKGNTGKAPGRRPEGEAGGPEHSRRTGPGRGRQAASPWCSQLITRFGHAPTTPNGEKRPRVQRPALASTRHTRGPGQLLMLRNPEVFGRFSLCFCFTLTTKG